jgi:hypothetical protein
VVKTGKRLTPVTKSPAAAAATADLSMELVAIIKGFVADCVRSKSSGLNFVSKVLWGFFFGMHVTHGDST